MGTRSDGRRPRTGLVLGGGAARGWAHLGVLRALEAAGVRPDCVAGSSVGALVGLLWASGGLEAVERVAGRIDRRGPWSFVDPVLPRAGLIDGRKVVEALREAVPQADLRDLPVPFAAVAVDLATGRRVVLAEGDPVEAVRASIAVPGLFTPVLRDGAILADGGLVDPVPVGVARAMGATRIIAVDISSGVGEEGTYLGPRAREGGGPNLLEVLLSTAAVTGSALAGLRLAAEPPDLLVRPAVGHLQFLDFGRADEAIAAGYDAMRAALPAAYPRRPRPGRTLRTPPRGLSTSPR